VDAAAVLGNLQIDGKIVSAFDTPGPEAGNGPVPAEFDPNTETITVYKDFFDTSANSQIERGRVLFVPPLSTEQFQVLILLHELDHVFGKQHQNTGDDPRKFNDALAQACLNSSLPPDSPSPPGGGFAVRRRLLQRTVRRLRLRRVRLLVRPDRPGSRRRGSRGAL
jgi:hypothetical protein